MWSQEPVIVSTPHDVVLAGLVQFCHKPGDVGPYKEAYEERQQILEMKRAEKAARKAAREQAANGGN